MNKKSSLLPINAIYFTWLRDYGKRNRPTARRIIVNHRTKTARTIEKTEMDMIDFMIYVSLLSRADKDKFSCFPSINAISEDCFGIDRRTITDHLQDLEQMEYIEVKRANGKSNTYIMKDFKEWLNNPRHKD